MGFMKSSTVPNTPITDYEDVTSEIFHLRIIQTTGLDFFNHE
jgi:hypothetical protein